MTLWYSRYTLLYVLCELTLFFISIINKRHDISLIGYAGIKHGNLMKFDAGENPRFLFTEGVSNLGPDFRGKFKSK
jgi:hypothetical protein